MIATRDDARQISFLGWTARAGFVLLALFIIIAIAIQDHTGALPLGLFNQGRREYALFSSLCLGATVLCLAILVYEAVRARRSRLAGVTRGLLASLVVVEVLFSIGDPLLMSGHAWSPLGGPYYTEGSADGDAVILRKDRPGLPPMLRAERPVRENARRRLLFLGDSYTEGSGRSADCNYTDVVQKTLREALARDMEVINGGVSAYGPVEALSLLRWLRKNRLDFDGIVYNLVLETDFTDNPPGTERRVVAGIIFRFPRSLFLRTFHPLNTRIFRCALFVWLTVTLSDDAGRAVSLDTGECFLHEERLVEVSPFLRELIERRLAGSRRVAGWAGGRSQAVDAITAMRGEAEQLGVPFFLVVFPDRALVDPDIQEQLHLDALRLEAPRAIRSLVFEDFAGLPIIDVTVVLEGRAGMYRQHDTHLSDLGNLVTGRYVGERLADYFAEFE